MTRYERISVLTPRPSPMLVSDWANLIFIFHCLGYYVEFIQVRNTCDISLHVVVYGELLSPVKILSCRITPCRLQSLLFHYITNDTPCLEAVSPILITVIYLYNEIKYIKETFIVVTAVSYAFNTDSHYPTTATNTITLILLLLQLLLLLLILLAVTVVKYIYQATGVTLCRK